MRRRRLGGPTDRRKVKALLKENNPGWKQTRLSALKMGFTSENSNAFIAESLGVSESSVKRWFAAFRKDGFEGALERGSSGGRPSGLDEEIKVTCSRDWTKRAGILPSKLVKNWRSISSGASPITWFGTG